MPTQRRHLSHSALTTFMRCSRQWAYRYLDDLKSPPGVALLKGRAIDDAATANFEQKIQSQRDLAVSDFLEQAESSFERAIGDNGGKSGVVWGAQPYEKAKDSTISLGKLHREHHAPLVQPRAVQQKLQRKLPDGRSVIGYVDFVRDDGSYGDIKTGSRAMPQGDADSDLQASAYAWLRGRGVRFAYWRVIDTGRGKEETRLREEVVQTTRDRKAIEQYETQFLTPYSKAIDDAVKSGMFPACDPGSWWCSPKFCGYWQRCKIQGIEPGG